MVTKAEFKRVYDQYGTEGNGWTSLYWNELLEPVVDMTWHLSLPDSPDEMRVLVVKDYGANEVRLLFLSEEAEESFFRLPENS